MANRLAIGMIVATGALVAIAVADTTPTGSEFAVKPTWELALPDAIYAQLQKYLDVAHIAADRQVAVRSAWSTSAPSEEAPADLLDRVANSLAKADDRVADLVERCAGTSTRGGLPEFAWLADSETPVFVRNNMRLYLARWLVQEGYYDEAIAWTEGLKPADVAAPDALLFYRAVAHQRLVEPDKATALLNQLVTRRDELPVRYQKLADLMRQDMAALEDDSLDHIARRMEDVRRRLAQGRSGQRVQKVENGVVESLDKLIKDIEDKMQRQQASGGAGSSGGAQSRAPMQDSQPAELKGPGKVDRKDIGSGSGWGDLPDKDRERALQDIGREFPSHYREIIEEYFRRLAAEEAKNGK